MDNLSIRKAKIEELKIVQDLNSGLFTSDGPRDKFMDHNWPYEGGKEYFSKKITDDSSICLVAEVDNEIVGYLAGTVMEVESWRPVKRTELENMFVKEEFRSNGIGAKLVSEFFNWSKTKGVQRSLVVAYATNEKAIKFYKKMGFDPESVSLEIEYKND